MRVNLAASSSFLIVSAEDDLSFCLLFFVWNRFIKDSQLAMLERDKHDISLLLTGKDSDILFLLFVHSLC